MTAQAKPGISVQDGARRDIARSLPEEVPVAMVFDGTTHAVMMATPADIEDFARGFALTEGIVTGAGDIRDFEVVEHGEGVEARFWLAPGRAEAVAQRRRSMLGPVGCGLCGIDSLSQAVRLLPRLPGGGISFAAADIAGAADALRAHQPLHDRTRAAHAAGFLRPAKGILMAREDVGRHNALDKLIGGLARAGIDPASGAVVLTSRISVEMVQKTVLAGARVLVAVSAPTVLALRMAEEAGLTLAAFARGEAFDIYAHPDRIG